MRTLFKIAIDAFAAARQKRVRERMLEQLDERTLRDIGLEHEANRARTRARHGYTRFGMY